MADPTGPPGDDPTPTEDLAAASIAAGAPGGKGPAASLSRATAVMTAGTTLSRLTGFVRLAVMAWAIGGAESKLPDTYQLANTLPNIVYQLVLGEVLATLFVPVFVQHITTRAREESWALASTMVTVSAVVAAAFSAVTVVLAPWLIKIYTFRIADPVVRAQQEAVGAFLLRLFMPQMIFYALGAVLTGLLNAHRRFALPMFAPVLNNLIATGTFIAFRAMHGARTPTLAGLAVSDKLLLGLGTTAGVAAMTLALAPGVRALPGRLRLRDTDWHHPALRQVARLAKYSFGYVIVNQVGLWVVKMLANGRQGGVAAYDTSFILYQLPYGIFAVSVMTALVPSLAEHHVRGDREAFRRDLSLGLRATAFVVMPAAAGFIALSFPIVRLLLEHGVFSGRSTRLFADTFAYMALGLAAYAAFQQVMRAFYAMQDTRTPWMVIIAANTVNIAAALALYPTLGVPGLGLAHAISYVLAVGMGGAILRRRLGGLDGRRLAASHLKIALASAVTGGGAWVAARIVSDRIGTASLATRLAEVGAGVGAGLVLYGVVVSALGSEELRPLLRLMTGRRARAFRR